MSTDTPNTEYDLGSAIYAIAEVLDPASGEIRDAILSVSRAIWALAEATCGCDQCLDEMHP